MKTLTESKEWQALIAHQQTFTDQHMRDWFEADTARFSDYTLSQHGLLLDYSRNRINKETLPLLIKLANACDLPAKIDALFKGLPINNTENRSVLHAALRDPNETPVMVKGENIAPLIAATKAKMKAFAEAIHSGKWKGVTGKTIKHVINIGIGGSYLGPKMCTESLKAFKAADLSFHYISTVDRTLLDDVIASVDPAATLVIISSKTFTTIETMTNAVTISNWFTEQLGKDAIKHHFVAVTTANERAMSFGIAPENIFPMWDWVGGRYSVWSAIGLPVLLALGAKQYDEFLLGAYEMDVHFKQADFSENMPVILGLLGIWYMNFYHTHVQAIIPYAHRLRYFVPYLQQAEMESNGKIRTKQGKAVNYMTSPVIFGEEGCNGQHAYHQLLHQGNHLIPADFILVGQSTADIHQEVLIASGLSQAQALMRGKTYDEAKSELLAMDYSEADSAALAHHRMIPGNRPSNVLFMDALTPKNLGAMIALYEHKIFVQGAIWDINSFDQWGVELGKQLLPEILANVKNQQADAGLDAATMGLIKHYKQVQGVE